jgi:hypothetical protein
LLFEGEARFPARPDFAVRFAAFFFAGAFLLFLAAVFRLPGVTLRTTSVVASPIDFCAAPALAAKLPNVEPMVSATLTNNPLFLSSALLSSVIYAPRLLGYRQKIQNIKEVRTHVRSDGCALYLRVAVN